MGLSESLITFGAFEHYKHQPVKEIGEQLVLLSAQINVATYHFFKMLAVFDNREGWRQFCMTSCCHWLNWKCGINYTTAREKLRVAHCLEKLPKINQEFKAGRVSYSKVRAMTRVATDENEHILLDAAIKGTANTMDKLVRRYQRVDEKQNLIEPVNEAEQRQINYYQDEEGMWVLRGRLPQVEGGLLIKALEEVIRQNNKNASAEAFQDASAEANSMQKRADALSALAEHFIATAHVDDDNGGIQALAGHERCQVVLHLSVDKLEENHKHGEGCNCNHRLDQQWISAKNAKRFSSDASLYTVLEDKYSNVLNIGRKTRTISAALKRTLDIRDETCRFPGCCNNKYVDFHHIQHWCDGGETEPDNLIKLCRFHHDLLHKGYYNITVQPQTEANQGQKWIFSTAFGEVIEPNPIAKDFIGKDNLKIRWPRSTRRDPAPYRYVKPLNYTKVIRELSYFKSV